MTVPAVSLTSPLELGGLTLKNRFVLASLNRDRSPDTVPNELNAEYYRQRTTAGFLLSEAVMIKPVGSGWTNVAHRWMVGIILRGKVTDAVHAEGSFIFAQLWHPGRCSHPALQAGQPAVAPSAIAANG
ncbi:hypothetical protein BDK51DRAFT_23314, partial [Blyttiomyces helicus]